MELRSEKVILGHGGPRTSSIEKVHLHREWIRNKLNDRERKASEKEREKGKQGREREKEGELALAPE